MPRLIAVTSDKGGVGKSTLALHLAGALAAENRDVLLLDEDGRVGSCVRWAARGPALPFEVVAAEDAKPKRIERAEVVVIDTEGRPKRKELRRLADRADLVLVPSGVSPLELESTLLLLGYLEEETDARRRVRVALTRVPPVGGAGAQAREKLREAGASPLNTMLRAYAAYTRAAEAGVLVRDVADSKAGQAWGDVVTLAREVG